MLDRVNAFNSSDISIEHVLIIAILGLNSLVAGLESPGATVP